MGKALSPGQRRKIIEFDPVDPTSVTIAQFCNQMGISRRAFYTIRQRYADESLAALHPHTTAPQRPHRIYDPDIVKVLLEVRQELKDAGWDYGPATIHFEVMVGNKLAPPIPSVSTIARMLKAAGAVERNPKKRPKSHMVRFQRGKAMELWQLDAFEYRLHDPAQTRITIYQLIDDASRLDVGTMAFTEHENSHDAHTCIHQAVTTYGVPTELLSDNGSAFNQLRKGTVGAIEKYLASIGTRPITGKPGHPQTQGKNERSHKTLSRYLDANQPTTVDQANQLIQRYRDRYNTRRPHQGLPGHVTPEFAWNTIPHAPAPEPYSVDELIARAQRYAQAGQRGDNTIIHDSGQQPPLAKRAAAKARKAPEVEEPIECVVKRKNPALFFQGFIISVPATFAERTYIRTIDDNLLTYWCADTGELAASFPLPLQAVTSNTRWLPSYNIKGAYLADAPDYWLEKHAQAEARFASGG